MIITLKCPKCKTEMKYMCRDGIITGKRKACVYCGKSYSVRQNIVQKKA